MSRILEHSNDEDEDCTAWKQMDFTRPPTKIRGNRGEKVVINVSGLRYETFEKTLETFPDSLLGDKHRRSFFFDPDQNEFFFDRNRICFESILAYYQTSGVLIRPPNIPRKVFLSDIRFFDLGEEALQQAGDTLEEPIEKRRNPLPRNKLQRRIWNLFEHPETSNFARALAIWSVCVILLSIILFCVETLPQFQKQSSKNKNGTSTSVESSSKQKNLFFVIEAFCITWFTVEYVVRFVVSPRKWKFFISVLNIIDLVSILPFYITLPMEGNASVSSLAILRSVRLVRVFRIFKLSRYSRGLQILGHTLKASLRELGLLFFFLCMGVILFSSAVYYAEISNENANDFKSIPHSFWWAIITMTTVGYGDITPKTLGGKLVGCFCAISGVLAIALPVPVIVSNFAYYYSKEHGRQTNIDDDEEGEDEEGDEMEEDDDIEQNGTRKMGPGFNYVAKDSDKSSNKKTRKRKKRNGKYPQAVYNSLDNGLPLENQNAVTNSLNGVKHQQGSDKNKPSQLETSV